MQAEADKYPESRNFSLQLGYRTILAVPLLLRREAIGVIARHPGRFPLRLGSGGYDPLASIRLAHKETHALQQNNAYSITLSARASSVAGTVRPKAFAVFMLITSSYLVGACTGRSAAFSPLRMRST